MVGGRYVTLVPALCLVAALVTTSPARADGGDTGPPPYRYQGTYWALQAHTGVVARFDPLPRETPGPLYGASIRLASFLSLLDVQAGFLGSAYSTSALDGATVGVSRWSVGVEGHFHPLMITILRNNTFWYWVAGIYLAGGIDLDITQLDPRGHTGRTEFDVGWHLGGGSDFPLTDPNEGWGLWLGVQYKLRLLQVASADLGLGAFHEHAFLLTIGYRNNDVFFFRGPRPDELDYRDPTISTE